MNTEVIKNFVANTVFKAKKIAPGIWTALSHAAGETADNTGFMAIEELKTILADDPTGIYNSLLPLKYSYGRKTPFDVVPEFTADKTEARKHLQGVYLDKENNTAVATDGKYLAFCDIPGDIAAGLEKSYIRAADGSEFAGQYPNYKMVIPADCSDKIELKNIHIYAGMCKAIINFEGCVLGKKYDFDYTAVELAGCRFDVTRLEKIFDAFCMAGDENVTMEYNSPDWPVLFAGKSGLQIVLMPLRSVRSSHIIDVRARVDILTAEYGNSCKRLFDCYKKLEIGGNAFHGTGDNPLAMAEIEISQSEINHLDNNIRIEYKGICSHIGAAACGSCNFEQDRVNKHLKETNFSLASDETAALHGEFINLVKSVKDNVTAFAVMPLLLAWMVKINNYVTRLMAAGYKCAYRDNDIALMPIDCFEDCILELLQKNIQECRITLEKAATIFPGGLDQYSSIARRQKNKAAEKEKIIAEMQSAIPADSGIFLEEVGGKHYYRHETCGNSIYSTIEELMRDKARIIEDRTRRDLAARQEAEKQEQERLEREKLEAEKADLHGFENTVIGIKRIRAMNYLNEVTPYVNAEIRGKKRREIVEMYLRIGYKPEERIYEGEKYYIFRQETDRAISHRRIDSKIEYEYACYLYENNIIQQDQQDAEKPKNNLCTCIVLDSGIEQSAPAVSDEAPGPDKDIPCNTIAPETPEMTKNTDMPDDPADLPHWDKARSLCTVSSGTLATLLQTDKYSVIERVEYAWQEYIARNGTAAENWQECWQEFQQSEDYNYLALLHGLPLPDNADTPADTPADDCPADISAGSDDPDCNIHTDLQADCKPDRAMCTRPQEHTDCQPDKTVSVTTGANSTRRYCKVIQRGRTMLEYTQAQAGKHTYHAIRQHWGNSARVMPAEPDG